MSRLTPDIGYDTSMTSISRRKTGCWTCRIRRKRCDENRDAQGNCQECVRLRIPCAGWGEQRPEWAKDEDALRQFKEAIKEKLKSRTGVRGPPPVSAADFTASHSISTTSEMAEILVDAAYIGSSGHGSRQNTGTRNSPDMFDYPELASQLYNIAQALHLPQEYMMHITQIAELNQWKVIQDNHGMLSYRELANRGKIIERVLLGQSAAMPLNTFQNAYSMTSASTTHINYSPAGSSVHLTPPVGPTTYLQPLPDTTFQSPIPNLPLAPQLSVFPQVTYDDLSTQTSQGHLIFTQACVFMLHCVVSGPNPRVPELAGAARNISTRLQTIPPNERSALLVFPLCIAAILAEEHELQFVQSQLNSLGAPPALMQAVHGLVSQVRQSRWTHEHSHAGPTMG